MHPAKSALAALLIAASATALAAFPDKPIRVVIGFPAGGPLDQHARLLSDRLQAVLGQPVLIDYKSGAGGTVGAQEVMKAAPDGYTLMLANTGVMVINPGLYSKLPYNTVRDFTPIARTAMQPLALLVNPKVPANSLKEFMDYARTRPGQVNYGSAGNGGISHLVPEMFKSATGLFMVHIPYRGSAPAFTDLMGGQVQFMAESIPQAASYHKQGKVKALAVTSSERSAALPDIPTIEQAGGPAMKGFDASSWFGLLAPAGTPADIVNRIQQEAAKALGTPAMKEKLLAQGAIPSGNTPQQFTAFINAEHKKWAQVVKASGAKVD
jgi:tripartite-type tricarboxylate transporter receptor subunit TctC